MAFQPTNRNIKEAIRMPGSDSLLTEGCPLAGDWYVDDIDHRGDAIAYRSPDCTIRVKPDMGTFILCTNRGEFLRHQRRDRRKGRFMRFKTPVLAAAMAEEIDAD